MCVSPLRFKMRCTTQTVVFMLMLPIINFILLLNYFYPYLFFPPSQKSPNIRTVEPVLKLSSEDEPLPESSPLKFKRNPFRSRSKHDWKSVAQSIHQNQKDYLDRKNSFPSVQRGNLDVIGQRKDLDFTKKGQRKTYLNLADVKKKLNKDRIFGSFPASDLQSALHSKISRQMDKYKELRNIKDDSEDSDSEEEERKEDEEEQNEEDKDETDEKGDDINLKEGMNKVSDDDDNNDDNDNDDGDDDDKNDDDNNNDDDGEEKILMKPAKVTMKPAKLKSLHKKGNYLGAKEDSSDDTFHHKNNPFHKNVMFENFKRSFAKKKNLPNVRKAAIKAEVAEDPDSSFDDDDLK